MITPRTDRLQDIVPILDTIETQCESGIVNEEQLSILERVLFNLETA